MIRIRQKGDFSKFNNFLERIREPVKIGELDKYGREGVDALESVTPKDTGLTSKSWEYKIVRDKGKISIEFFNTNIQNGVPIAIILQYGHVTKNGGWVQGIDYINPVIQPLFNKIADSAWKEVTK